MLVLLIGILLNPVGLQADSLTQPFADSATSPVVDSMADVAAIHSAQNSCLAATKTKGAFIQSRDALMDSLDRAFCTQPEQFCQQVNRMQTSGADPHFVSSDCRNGALPLEPMDWVTTKLVQNKWDASDPFIAQFVADAWDCDAPQLAGAEIRANCRDIPFHCTDKPFIDKKVATDKLFAPKNTLLKMGVHFAQNGGACRMSIPRGAHPTEKSDHEVVQHVFSIAAGELVRPFGFKMLMHGTFTPERRKLLNLYFAAAKNGLLQYLKSLGTPPIILRRVEKTALADLDIYSVPFEKLTKADISKIAVAQMECRPSKAEVFGMFQAFNRPVRGSNTIVVCPQAMFRADLGDPKYLLLVLGHELGHSIDPCELGKLELNFDPAPKYQGCKSSVVQQSAVMDQSLAEAPATTSEATGLMNYINQIRGEYGFAACLSNKYISDRGEFVSDALQSIISSSDECLSETRRCELRESYGHNRLSSCSYPWYNLTESLPILRTKYQTRCSALITALTRIQSMLNSADGNGKKGLLQQAQTSEAFADFMAAGSLAYSINDPSLPHRFSKLPSNDREADLLNLISFSCVDYDLNPDLRHVLDAHPDWRFRASVFSNSPRLRQLLGCEKFSAQAGRELSSKPKLAQPCEELLKY